MNDRPGYILGQSDRAARRLALQDGHFAAPSERLLDELALPAAARVVELGCGPGGFSRRILGRLGPGGAVVGVDGSDGLLAQAQAALADVWPARFEGVLADVSAPGPWLEGADAVVGRAVLHHIPVAEALLGRLRAAVRPGTPVGFLEPDFRAPLARIGYLEATGRPELAALRVWGTALYQLYQARGISPAVGATLGAALEQGGYRDVRVGWAECPSDEAMLENMVMVYEEIEGPLDALGILPRAETARQRGLLAALPPGDLPAAWRMTWAAAIA